ncbi:hypothetical protein KP509_05G059600 [Ceratopteris richardii]|uniref:Uncharacterized protein n=1 Tax=Ceratopteris richardii TaxID=49495 RepID=A0A8T2UQZ2_CERRI|nr:hypothetical protein KP509_05G059600 [Ceratopteris richardii]
MAFAWAAAVVTSNPKFFAMANVSLVVFPFLIGAISWISSLSSLMRFAVGFLFGLLVSTLLFLAQRHRSELRRAKAFCVAQLSYVSGIYMSQGNARSWLYHSSEYEKVDWLNRELEEVWPSLNKAASGLLKVILQSVLDPYKFSIIRKITIKSITLGTVSPLFSGVKFSAGGEDEAILEVELDWRHGQDAKVVIELQTTGPLLTVQIRDLVVFGILKLIFRPLKEQFPGFGAVTISLKEPPTVDFQTKFLGGDLLAIPGVDNAVDNIILTALTDLLVWPNRLVIPILEGDYSFLMLKPIGELKVELVEGRDVAKADIWGESDPYALIYIRRKQGCIWTSSTKMNTSCPVWNEIHTFDVEDLESQSLTIRLYDYDKFSNDDFIGIGQISLGKLEPNTEEDIWVDLVQDLKKKEDQIKAKVHLRVTYKPLLSDGAGEMLMVNEAPDRTEQGNSGPMGTNITNDFSTLS